MREAKLLAAAFLGLASIAAAQTAVPAASSALDKAVMEQYVRHLFVWGPQIQVQVEDPKPSTELPGFKEITVAARAGQASQSETFLVSNDGKRIIRGTVYDVAKNPFAGDASKLNIDGQPSFGALEAPVTLVVFSDFQCSYCKEEARILRKEVASAYPTQVRVYFKDFPLEPIHPWAKPAAVAGRCVFRQKPAAFWDYHDWIFENQGEITPDNLKTKVTEWATSKQLEPIQLAGCIDKNVTAAEVEKNQAEGRTLGINSTPTLFINGRRLVGGVPFQNLKTIIDHEIEYQKTHGGSEKCCEVTLPSPLGK